MAALKPEPDATRHGLGGQGPRRPPGDPAEIAAYSTVRTDARRFPLLGNNSVTASEQTAQKHKRIFMELARDACERDGTRAFEAPRHHAALHEAGHAVIAAAAGKAVSSIRVNQKFFRDMRGWYGLTRYKGGGGVLVGPLTSPEHDFIEMRRILAGVLAELFAPDFRSGSSLDEVAMGCQIAQGIAAKTGVPGECIFEACALTVAFDLQQNKFAFDLIVAALCRNTVLRGSMLRPLRDVRRYSPSFEDIMEQAARMDAAQ